jgi:hypothetical protein
MLKRTKYFSYVLVNDWFPRRLPLLRFPSLSFAVFFSALFSLFFSYFSALSFLFFCSLSLFSVIFLPPFMLFLCAFFPLHLGQQPRLLYSLYRALLRKQILH